jgi:hypothetical protein
MVYRPIPFPVQIERLLEQVEIDGEDPNTLVHEFFDDEIIGWTTNKVYIAMKVDGQDWFIVSAPRRPCPNPIVKFTEPYYGDS